MNKEWPIWEVFVRSKQGLDHKHCGSLHALDASAALRMARDVYVYTRRQEGVSIWVVPSVAIYASTRGQRADPGPAQCGMVQLRPGTRRRHRAREHQSRSDRTSAVVDMPFHVNCYIASLTLPIAKEIS